MKPPIKIAIVVSHPIQHFCPQYVSFAKNKNIELKVFFGSALGYKKYLDQNFREEISWGNLQLEKFDHVFLNGDAVLQANKYLDAPSLEQELNIYAPDCLIQYGYFQQLQKRAYRWAVNRKVVLAYISDAEMRQERSVLKEWVKSFYLKRHFSKVSHFLTVGNANEEFYLNHAVPAARLLRMHFPIDVRLYEKSYGQRASLNEQVRNQHGIEKGAIIMSVVGKLVDWKNQDQIIDAMEILENQGLTLHLFMLGSGEKKEAWIEKSKALKSSKVYFPGFVSIEQLPAYYAATDIYICPAGVEPHSIAISEAVYMGCPVIVSDRSGSYGPEDDVQDGQNGIVYPFGNIALLVAAIKSLVVEPWNRQAFSVNSHQRAIGFQQMAHFGIVEKLLNEMEARLGMQD